MISLHQDHVAPATEARDATVPRDRAEEKPTERPLARIGGALRARIFYACAFGAVEDALVAASATWRAHSGATSALAAGVETFCLLALPLALIAVPLGGLASARGSRALAQHVRTGLSGNHPALEPLAAFLFAVVFATSIAVGWATGLRVSDFQSARVATLISTLVSLGTLGLGALLVSAVTPHAEKWARWVTDRTRAVLGFPFEEAAVGAVCIAAVYLLIPPSHAITPAAAIAGFAIGPALGVQMPLLSRAAGAAAVRLSTLALLLSLGAAFSLKHLPDAAQEGAIARAPYGAIAITAMRRVLDRDRDGYSPAVGGGDCDDANPAIHPGAADVPDNGVDENCSGSDAHKFTPPPPPVARDANAPPERNNIVLIHIDALRPDHVGFAGYARPTTPHLDKWREGATWFKNAYSPAPSTRFALSMLFTGLEIEQVPQQRGHVIDFTLLPGALTLAERLAPLGYDRVGYTLSYVLQHIFDLGQGFRVWDTPWPVEDWSASYPTSAEQTTAAALKYLATVPPDGTKPYLLFLHYACTHDPYVKHAGWDYGSGEVDRYDSALNYCDAEIGRVLDALDARTDSAKNAVFVYSDHGELFGEHGFTRHGSTVFEPDVRALLVAKIPGGTAREIETPMYLTDVTPTICDLTGLAADPGAHGWDLAPYIRGAPLPPRQLFFYADLWRDAVHFNARGVLDADGKTKLVFDLSTGTRFLFDLKADPGELSNIADAQPAVVNRLAERLDSWEAYANRFGKSFELFNTERK